MYPGGNPLLEDMARQCKTPGSLKLAPLPFVAFGVRAGGTRGKALTAGWTIFASTADTRNWGYGLHFLVTLMILIVSS